MTTIKYHIGSHTGGQTTVDTYNEALIVREQIKEKEIEQLKWWPIVCWITNNDGTITMCPIDENGNPVMFDQEGNIVPYVDTTTAPQT